MLSFLRTQTPRTTTAHLNPISYDGGRASQHFHRPGDKYLVTDVMPPTTPEHGRGFFNPPLHYHMHQTEDFEIISGEARFFIDSATPLTVHEGDKVYIPIGAFHRFENSSDKGEPLVVTFRLDEQNFDVEERFFRNFFGYLDDVVKAGQEPSFFQLSRFLYAADIPVVVPGLGEKSTFFGRLISWFVMVLAGLVIGEWLLGYQGSYPEYYLGDKQQQSKKTK